MKTNPKTKKDTNEMSRPAMFIGLVIALSVVLVAFNWNFHYQELFQELATNEQEFEEIQNIPITEHLPPPPPEPVFVDPNFNEVEDEEIEETLVEMKQIDLNGTRENTKPIVRRPTIQKPPKAKIEEETIEEPLVIVEKSAETEGGMEAFYKYVKKKIKFPANVQRMGIEGKVFVQFVVEKDGSLSEIEIVKGIHPDCDAEAKRVIELFMTDKKAPKWIPAEQRYRKVRQRMVIPIYFQLK